MPDIAEYLPFLIPLAVIEVVLTTATIVHALKHPKYRFGSKAFWIVMAFVQIVGPVVYFAFGRGEE